MREADGHPFFSRWKNHIVEVYERHYCLIYVYDDRALFLRFSGKKESFLENNSLWDQSVFGSFIVSCTFILSQIIYAEKESERKREMSLI